MASILLDRNVPGRLRYLRPDHDVRTTFHMGWAALTNGAPIAAAETAGFDALVTADGNLRHQRKQERRRLALVVLTSNKRSTIQRNMFLIELALRQVGPGTVRDVFLERDQG